MDEGWFTNNPGQAQATPGEGGQGRRHCRNRPQHPGKTPAWNTPEPLQDGKTRHRLAHLGIGAGKKMTMSLALTDGSRKTIDILCDLTGERHEN